MTEICKTPYGTWAPVYRELGLSPRPCIGKECFQKAWPLPDAEQPNGRLDNWQQGFATANIGLLMGTKLSDGTHLGALDIDHNDYVRLGRAVLGDPKCGRVGKKGAVFFVRYEPQVKFQKKYKAKGEFKDKYGQMAEWLVERQICIIPPSLHPDTKQPYRWLGTPLHEMELTRLPLIGG